MIGLLSSLTTAELYIMGLNYGMSWIIVLMTEETLSTEHKEKNMVVCKMLISWGSCLLWVKEYPYPFDISTPNTQMYDKGKWVPEIKIKFYKKPLLKARWLIQIRIHFVSFLIKKGEPKDTFSITFTKPWFPFLPNLDILHSLQRCHSEYKCD